MQQETNVSDLKRKTLTNTLWNFVERAGSQIVSFIVQIVLARILLPPKIRKQSQWQSQLQ